MASGIDSSLRWACAAVVIAAASSLPPLVEGCWSAYGLMLCFFLPSGAVLAIIALALLWKRVRHRPLSPLLWFWAWALVCWTLALGVGHLFRTAPGYC
jgi:hypothetical protein